MSTGKGFLGWGPRYTCPECGLESNKTIGTADPQCERCGKYVELKPGDEKLLRYLWEMKHHTPFEMPGLTIEVMAPIMVFREWHRHRVPFGYNEMSARYTPLPNVNYVPTVERLMRGSDGKNKQAGTIKDASILTEDNAQRFRNALEAKYKADEELYQWALGAGVPKELARVHLPVGRYSRMRATGNLRGWLGFLTLRMPKTAQEEIRLYAEAIGNLIAQLFPRTWQLFSERK